MSLARARCRFGFVGIVVQNISVPFARKFISITTDSVQALVDTFVSYARSIALDARFAERVSEFITTTCRLNPGVDSRASNPNATR